MGVLMQAFYWNCPDLEKRDFHWWEYVESQVASLSQVGFTSLWLPPASKGGQDGGKTMGYDEYDYYDLGELNQKGTIPTWFGTKEALLSLITTAHKYKMQVYADLVLNQNSGGDASQVNPIDHQTRWTLFQPLSNRFKRDWECFQPSYYEEFSGVPFGDMPLLCHRNPNVYTEIIGYARWLLDIDDNETGIGFDGFRYDCAKGYGAWMTRAIQELRGLRGDVEFNPFGVGEVWDTDRSIENWLAEVNTWSDNPVSAFDFSLRDKLKNLCDTYGYSLKDLNSGGTLLSDDPTHAVTFVENHDTEQSNPIINDKILAYAFILTHQGYPCVFWKDYYSYGLVQKDKPYGIDALVRVHELWAAGTTSVLYTDDTLYIMQRNGADGKKRSHFRIE